MLTVVSVACSLSAASGTLGAARIVAGARAVSAALAGTGGPSVAGAALGLCGAF